MKRRMVILLCLAVVFLLCGVCEAERFSPKGETFYTQINIWCEYPKEILSTNFHKGDMIPVGTKVKIKLYGATKIKFVVEETGVTYVLKHAVKHSWISRRELFDRYFAKENPMDPGGPFEKFTEEEKKNVLEGKIDVGMTKNAVIMAYGYPPTHRTRSLSDNPWTYWASRAGRFLVFFEDGKIESFDYGE